MPQEDVVASNECQENESRQNDGSRPRCPHINGKLSDGRNTRQNGPWQDGGHAELIQRVEQKIAEKVGQHRFNVWFRNAVTFALVDEYLRVCTPNSFVGEWIERHFSGAIADATHEVTGTCYLLSFATEPALARHLGKKQPDRQVDYVAANPERLARAKVRRAAHPVSLSLRGRMADFVVGPSNQLAAAAAQSVMEQPCCEYNPLFIHGGCGLGKTHLLQAICNGLSDRHPSLKWRYVSGEEFMNEFVCAVKSKELDVFQARYRQQDALVIDDVHFLANKRATQQEFLHTVKAISTAGKQIVLASDAHPKMIGHFSEALVSRFLAGMVVRVEPPDLEVRLGVLRKRAQHLKAAISDAVIRHVAENFCTNLRELEGALLKIVAQAQVLNQPITLSLAEAAIKDLVRQTAPVVMLSDIETVVAIYFGLTPADLHTSRKSRTIALARGIAMYLARKHTDMSFPEIGRFMGNKNHSTVILATRRIAGKLNRGEAASWTTPEGVKEQDLATIIAAIEGQIVVRTQSDPAKAALG